jgi:hypothetical protein
VVSGGVAAETVVVGVANIAVVGAGRAVAVGIMQSHSGRADVLDADST